MEEQEDVSRDPQGKEGEIEQPDLEIEPLQDPSRRIGLRGFRRRVSESARDTPIDGLSRLTRLGNGLRRRLSGSTRDIFSVPDEGTDEIKNITSKDGLRRHVSASMRDLILPGGSVRDGGGGGGGEESEGLGRKLSRRLSLLAGSVASRADHTRGSLRARFPNLRRSRSFTVNVVLPDTTIRNYLATSPCSYRTGKNARIVMGID
ncbi:hypothetical protein Pcinc_021779 [Petrolisthes cinctipes]|uniref:Uncharacterized protein n=1 Tax=Petrolisthes cinctipes TaxID=88211 RepID=A0AAE1FFW1_PETCI|nr:hypothetical protein Pcinc_021779 [Petrolisthes cinctipes]